MTTNNNKQKPKLMVQNVSCIIPQSQKMGGLFLGNTYGAQNAQILKQYGIRAVLTTSIETPIKYNPVDIPFHLKISAHDKKDYQIYQHLNQCLEFIHSCRQLTNVFVHCYAGVSRSSTIVIAYIMKYWKWNLITALAFVQSKRIVTNPNQGFMEQLRRYQQQLKSNKSNNGSNSNVYTSSTNSTVHPSIRSSSGIHTATSHSVGNPHPQHLNNQHSHYVLSHAQTSNIVTVAQRSKQQIKKSEMSSANYINNTIQQNNLGINYNYPSTNTNNIGGMNNTKISNSLIKRHSQTPIPKILVNNNQKKQKQIPKTSKLSPYHQNNTQATHYHNSINNNYNTVVSNERYHTNSASHVNVKGGYSNNSHSQQIFNNNINNISSGITKNYTSSNNNINNNLNNNQNNNNITNINLNNVKSSKTLIRPKDLPGYKN